MPGPTAELGKVRFRFTKSPSYQVVMCSGAWGGVVPQGLVSMELFMDRLPVPDVAEHDILPGGAISQPPTLSGIQEPRVLTLDREVMVGVLMDANTARQVAGWLVQKAQEVEQIQAAPTTGIVSE